MNGMKKFLFVYFRFLDLSIDRARWQTINALNDYLWYKLHPSEVVKYMKKKMVNESINETVNLSELKPYRIDLSLFFNKFFRSLTDVELYTGVTLLEALVDRLEEGNDDYDRNIEELRVKIAKYAYWVIRRKVVVFDTSREMDVEHFGQNPLNTSVMLSEWIPQELLSR